MKTKVNKKQWIRENININNDINFEDIEVINKYDKDMYLRISKDTYSQCLNHLLEEDY